MRSLQLQAALTELVAQTADRLHALVTAGEEVPFELDARSGRGRGTAALYCYRPLTGRFIAEHFPELRRLDAYAQAAELLDRFDGLERYLIASGYESRGRGGSHGYDGLGGGRSQPRQYDGPGGKHLQSRARVDAALLALLEDTFDEQTDFDRSKADHDERLDRALERLEGATLAAAGEITLVATLHGLTIASPELALARGLLIAHPDALQDLPDQALGGARSSRDGLDEPSRDGQEHLLVVFSAQDSGPRAAVAQGEDVLRELLRALRLFGDGRIALGALAWARVGSAPWRPLALGMGGHPHGMLVVSAEQEDELRAFCNLISRRAPQANELAWALRRFELGCERPSEYEGLSDHLLALRALLGAPSELEPAGLPDGLLAARLSALCATPEQRAQLAERTLKAIALERRAISGTAKQRAGDFALARELSDHLRALLRDVICGHLPAELAALADELLLDSSGGSSGEQPLGDEAQAAEILHVAV